MITIDVAARDTDPDPSIEHAPWCVSLWDFDACEGGTSCYRAPDQFVSESTVRATAGGRGRQRNQFLEIRCYPARELSAEYRSGFLREDELHVIHIGIGHEGWDSEPWAHFSLEDARRVQAAIGRAIALAEEDAEHLRAGGIGVQR